MNLENPFPGLRPFREEESGRFFGQEDRIRELVNRLAHTRFVAVIGQSGCGKSSLVHAGLLAALRKSGRWRIGKLSPGEDPLANLTRAWRSVFLESADAEAESETADLALLSELRRDARALCRMAEQAQLRGSEGILLFVDQFEELFRFRHPEEPVEKPIQREDHAAHFVNLLLEAVRDEDSGIHVVITMRSEFLGDCATFYDLAEQVNRGTYLVPKMDRDSAEDAIVCPIDLHGAAIEPSLVQHLLNESEAVEDGLPLLQHALRRVWDRWRERKQPNSPIGFADLKTKNLGDLLNEHLNSIYGELPPARQKTAERIFRLLSDRDAKERETRRLQRWNDLSAGLPEALRSELNKT
jgi:hypothetical protein